MRLIAICGLVLLVTLAGCSSVPFGGSVPQEEPAPVRLVNNATITGTFEVAVVDLGANVTVTRGDDEPIHYTIHQGSTTIENPETNPFTNAKFPDSARIQGEYTLEPGESKQLSVEKIASYEAIVVLIYDDPEGTYRAIKSLNCGGQAILGYKVETQAEGEDDTLSIHSCG